MTNEIERIIFDSQLIREHMLPPSFRKFGALQSSFLLNTSSTKEKNPEYMSCENLCNLQKFVCSTVQQLKLLFEFYRRKTILCNLCDKAGKEGLINRSIYTSLFTYSISTSFLRTINLGARLQLGKCTTPHAGKRQQATNWNVRVRILFRVILGRKNCFTFLVQKTNLASSALITSNSSFRTSSRWLFKTRLDEGSLWPCRMPFLRWKPNRKSLAVNIIRETRLNCATCVVIP